MLTTLIYSLPGTLADGHLELLRRQSDLAALLGDTRGVGERRLRAIQPQASHWRREALRQENAKRTLVHKWPGTQIARSPGDGFASTETHL
jgi:hypothetical protein